jgi:ADP-ribose pyrophosphatase
MLKKWPKTSAAPLADHRIFKLRHEQFVSPRTGYVLDATIVEAADWVNVVAITEDQQCVLIRQYRFGSETVTLEIPGGVIDPGETPFAAAQRELLEETGYEAARWTALGSIAPNPAFQRNRLHSFLAEGCREVAGLQQDEGEDIEVELAPYAQIDELLARGAFDHALVAVAFQKVALLAKGVPSR